MGKFSHIWKRSEDGSFRKERSFVRWVIFTATVFILFVCVIKHDNVFRWIKSSVTVAEQRRQIEYYKENIESLTRQIDALTQDRDSLENYARERFYFSEPGEQVYIVK